MQLVYLNSLEKQTGENRVVTAQLSVCEDKGQWYVYWNEPRGDGRAAQDCWYEGQRVNDMLLRLRERLNDKLSDGYVPLVGDIGGLGDLYAATNEIGMLQFYSERHMNEVVYEALRQWRRERAAREGKSPFIVATNAMLKMVSAFLPHTVEELRQIPGWEKRRAEVYGDELLGITRGAPRTTTFPLDWVPLKIDSAEFRQWVAEERRQKHEAMNKKRDTRKRVLERIAEGAKLHTLQEELAIRRDDLLKLVEALDREGYDVQPLVEAELQSVPDGEIRLAWQVFEQEGDRYLKPVVHRIASSVDMAGKDMRRLYEWLRLLRLKSRREKNDAP